MNINQTTTAPTTTRRASCEQPEFTPASDIYETPDAILIRCNTPGVAEEDLEITLSNNVITLTGTQHGQDRDAGKTSACEYQSGVYRRSFGIKRDLDESAVKARLKDGVLEIELPKQAKAGPRRIPISD